MSAVVVVVMGEREMRDPRNLNHSFSPRVCVVWMKRILTATTTTKASDLSDRGLNLNSYDETGEYRYSFIHIPPPYIQAQSYLPTLQNIIVYAY